MRVLQINAIYERNSTGRTTKELHEAMLKTGIESFVACPDIGNLSDYCYKIGNRVDRKVHAFFSRILGNQGYYSRIATYGLIKFIGRIHPDIIHLRNLHSNYINIPMLLKYIARSNICTVITLHDSWFYTGKCVYYIEDGCNKWKQNCGKCPALKKGNPSLLFDRSRKMLRDKKHLLGSINNLAVIGVSEWVTRDVGESILKDALIIKCIYNWIDLNKFKPKDSQELKNKLGLNGRHVILGIAMIWNKQKGIEIFHDLSDILSEEYRIVLVGDSSLVSSRRSNITYIGEVKNVDELSMFYSMADVFVNPTIQETFGKTTAEALASGTPVVAFNGTATPELVGTDEKCGFLINENKAENYKEKIIEIIKGNKDSYSHAARNRAEVLFSKEKNIKKYLDIYETLCRKESSRENQ